MRDTRADLAGPISQKEKFSDWPHVAPSVAVELKLQHTLSDSSSKSLQTKTGKSIKEIWKTSPPYQ